MKYHPLRVLLILAGVALFTALVLIIHSRFTSPPPGPEEPTPARFTAEKVAVPTRGLEAIDLIVITDHITDRQYLFTKSGHVMLLPATGPKLTE